MIGLLERTGGVFLEKIVTFGIKRHFPFPRRIQFGDPIGFDQHNTA